MMLDATRVVLVRLAYLPLFVVVYALAVVLLPVALVVVTLETAWRAAYQVADRWLRIQP